MKLKRRRASEVPPKIRLFINSVTSTPLENIQEPLKGFVWDFDKGDFHHWVDLFNHFDSYFEKHIKPRKDLCFEDDFLECDPPFPREAVLQILWVMRIILENCTNKHFLSCYEHLSSLMASADADVVEASLQTLATFLKKTVGKYSIRDASLSSRLLSFAQGWGCKEEGLGLTACTLENGCDTVAYELGRTLHFEFYRVAESSTEYEAKGGLQIIHVPDVISRKESDLELLNMLLKEYGVPSNLRFSLFTRLRFARAFGSLASRQQYTCIRLYAFVVLIQASSNADDLTSFFNTEPEFTNELVSLLSYEDLIPEKIRTLSLRSLVALSQDRTRQPTVLAAVTSGRQRGILSSLMQKAIDSVSNGSSKWSVVFAEALLSLVTILVSSSSGCSAMREAGFIPTLLPLLKDTDPQHLHLVGTAVHVLEAFMDYSNPAAALFRDLGGLDETINRLKVEVSVIENGLQQSCGNSDSSRTSTEVIVGTSAVLDDIQPLYSVSLLAHHRRLLMKALLRAINLGTYAPGSTDRIYGSEESLLPQCLCIIFRKAKDFGGGVFSLAATVMSDLIHKDPTCFSVLDAAGLPSAFMDAIMDGVVFSADAITCIPQCLDALCLNNNGLQAVKDRNALSCFVKIFTSKAYLRALAGDAPGALSSGLDELMRHAATLREPGVDILIEILNTILKLGSADDSSPSVDSLPCPAPVLMDTDSDVRSLSSPDERESQKTGSTDLIDLSSDATVVNLESYLPDCVSNACRLLETILQNSDACRLFIDKKGVEAVLQMFTLPLLPVSVSVGQSVSTAFKNFSAQHSASLAKAVCAFLKEHLNTTIEVIDSIEGTPIASLESAKQTKVTRCLSSLEGLLSLSNSLLKGTTTLVSELGAGDADVLKDIGRVYREVLWQISLSCDTKAEQKQNVEVETENAEVASSTAAGRESDEDAGIPVVRYINPVSIRSGSQSQWAAGERDFWSVIRSGEGLSRRNRHGLTRIRGGRTGRHLDSFNMDSDVSANVQEPSSSLEHKKKSPDVLASDILSKLSGTMRSFYTALIKGISSPNRRRADSGVVSSVAKNVGTVLAKIFLEALSFSGYSSPTGLEMSLSVKCRYLGKVVHDMAALTFDSRRRMCHTAMVNNFYVNGSFKELLTTFEATSQLLWSLPHSIPISGVDPGKVGEGSKLDHNSWLLDTLQCYCRLLEYFVNSSLLLSPTSPSQAQLLVQPVAVGLSIGLFPVPRDPEVFVRMLQSQVLDVILPVWNHPMFPHCSASFITSVLSLVTHIYSGVGDIKRNRSGVTGSSNQRVAPPPDEASISTIVEMGFSRARAEEALRRVESNSVEMAMDWLCTHAEDPVHEEDELAQALALSLGSSAETSKSDNNDKSVDVQAEEGQMKVPPVDDILGAAMKFFQSGDSLAFPLTDLLATLCNRNKGEDRLKVASYLIQQLKLCSSDLSKDVSAVSSISHILALLLSEDADAREIAAQNGIVSVAIDILKNSRSNQLGKDVLSTKSTSALLLILDNLLQSRPKFSSANAGIASTDPLPDSSEEHASVEASVPENEEKLKSGACEESVFAFEKIFGKSTGHLSMNECHSVLEIACDMLKQQVSAVIMQAVLQLCARLTKTHELALQFIENGGMAALFDLPRSCFFAGYDTLASAIVRHLLEDPQTLQTAMELEIRQTLSGGRHAGRIPTRIFLTSMAPVISRDPVIFTKAATAVCQLESSAGRTVVVLLKEKEKEKERSKVTGATEGALSSNEPIRIPETKVQDGPGKGSKGHKKIPVNLAQVIDQLLEIILQFPCSNSQEDCTSYQAAMEVDEPGTSVKGKSKIDEATKGDSVVLPESSAALAKVIFVLKLLSDILLMYVHAISVVLKRDSEICQLRVSSQLDSPGQGGIVHHVLHKLLPLSSDKSSKPGDLRAKLSEKASWFLVVLCGRSSEGRRRVISELVKALSLYTNLDSNSLQRSLLPDRKVLAFVELAYSVLSKNASSSSLSVSGYSPDIARGLIDGGIVPCLSSILQAIDLDHPDASKIANLILKALESLTRAANASEQSYKSDVQNKKKSNGSQGRSDDQTTNAVVNDNTQHNDNRISEQEAGNAQVDGANPHEGAGFTESTHGTDVVRSDNQDVRAEGEGMQVTNATVELAMEFPGDEMEEGDLIHNSNRIGMEFHIEHRGDEGVGDEDDDMGGEGEEEEDEEDDDGEDEDEDIAEDGTALMSLADTDVDDHEDAGFGDDYNDEMIDDEEDDYHENRVIEVRWREALGGFHHLQVAQSGSGLVDVPSEPFEGVNVDDLFGLRRTLGFDRRRQTSRSFDRNNTDGGIQHPLLSRPPQLGDVSLWSSAGNLSRDSESLSGAGVDVSQFYMFDTPPFLYDLEPGSVIGVRSGGTAPPPLTDYSVGMDSSQLVGRRGPGDGRWADDGQPQAGNQASAIAQAVEEVFVSVLHGASTTETPVGIQSQNTSQPEQQLDAGQNCDSNLEMEGNPSRDVHGQGEVQLENGETEAQQTNSQDIVSNQGSINAQAVTEVAAVHESEPLSSNIAHHSMESEDGNDPSDDLMRIEQEPLPSADPVSDMQHGADIGDLDNLRDDQMEFRVADVSSGTDSQLNNDVNNPDLAMLNQSEHPSVCANPDIEMAGTNEEPVQINQLLPAEGNEPVADQNAPVNGNSMESDHVEANAEPSGPNAIDPTFLEALPEDLRAEVLASQQSQPTQPPTYTPPSMEDIDPEFLAALPPEIQAEVLAQQRVQRLAQQSEGQPVDMDNASIIATLPADLREEVLLTSSEAVLSALPSPLLAEAQMLRDRAMSHYQARSLFGSSHRLPNHRNGLGFDRQSVMDRGVGVTIGRRTGAALSDVLKVKEVEGEPLLDGNALKALIRLLRLAQPLGKGLLQRLLLNLCAHSVTRATLIYLLLKMIKPEAEGVAGNLSMINPQRLYGCSPNMVHGQSQLLEGLPPLVLRRVLEILNYLATNHSSVANTLFYFEPSLLPDSSQKIAEAKKGKGKEKVGEPGASSNSVQEYEEGCTPLILLLKLLNRPLFQRSIAHVEQVMGLLQVVVYTAASRLESLTPPEQVMDASQNLNDKASDEVEKDVTVVETETSQQNEVENGETSISDKKTGGHNVYDIFTQLPRCDLRNLSRLLGHEGLSDKVYMLAGEVLKKLASVIASHRKFFTQELSDLAQDLSSAAVSELNTLKNTRMMGLGAGSMAGAAMLRVLQALSSLISQGVDGSSCQGSCEEEEQAILLKLNSALEPLWQELSNCISTTELELGQSTLPPIVASMNSEDGVGSTLSSPPLPPGTQRLLPFIESFFVLCEKLQSSSSFVQQDQNNVTAQEVKESADASSSTLSKCGADSQRRFDSAVIFSRFADKHRRLLNAFIRQNPGLLEKSLSMMLKAPRLIDFDNKRAYFRSRIRHQHEQHLAGPLRISVRRAYVLEDSYNQLRMRSNQDLKGRLNVQFQGEEGIDAGGLTREWYQLLSRVIFDKGALLFTTVGNNATFQPNPNSVYQTEHLSYFKFVGRVVAKALFDGQLLDVYFTRSFYKHILGVKVTYHDIEAVDPDYYKNLKWLLENDVNDILDLTFSMDADEEKLILYEKTQVTDYELKPGGRNIRVTEETKHEYVDLVADHILTNAIRPQINSFLEGFNELVPRELISIFNDKELELLISGLPEIDLDDLKVNTEYTGYTVASNVIQWFWEVASSFSKEDMARLLQFVTGTSKVPLEGFKALQGISGPQKFQIHKAYGAPERLPSAHTCFNQLDLPEYSTKEQLRERLLLAIHEASEGFGFG